MNLLDGSSRDRGQRAMRELTAHRRVIVTVGSGGVGKTTTAAALGLLGALLGRRTLVITIDPARRLANALGLDVLSHAPQCIDEHVMGGVVPQRAGSLSAMMLDPKAAWDDMLLRTAPDEATARKIFENRFYETLSRDLPGTFEFIACECLHRLASSGDWDLVVLDTPPTANAIDFLDAPGRILGVLDNDAFRAVASKKESLGLRFLDGAAGRAQSVLARFTGGEIIEEIGELIVLLRDLYAPLTERIRALDELMHGENTAFVIVSSPEARALTEATRFVDELARRKLPLGALVLNRLTPSPTAALELVDSKGWESELQTGGLRGPELASLRSAIEKAIRQQDELAALDRAHIEAALPPLPESVPVVAVPRLTVDVRDVRRLGEIVEALSWEAPLKDVHSG